MQMSPVRASSKWHPPIPHPRPHAPGLIEAMLTGGIPPSVHQPLACTDAYRSLYKKLLIVSGALCVLLALVLSGGFVRRGRRR